MTDRRERQFLWLLVLVVGCGLCAFAVVGRPNLADLALLPAGAALILLSAIRIRRLSRRERRF
jgi:hypothetical protein